MSKKFCKESKELAGKVNGKKNKYLCTKCLNESPKEKWCCKPKKIKQ